MKYQIRHVQDCSVVQLEDGRVGWKGVNTKSTNRNLVIFADKTGIELTPTTQVEVIKYPANLASEYVQAQTEAEPSNPLDLEPDLNAALAVLQRDLGMRTLDDFED